MRRSRATDEFKEEEIFQAPVIVREPSSRQAKLGSKVVLRVVAEGKPIPSFQWYHNGKKITGATTDRLTLSKVRRLAAGAYHCEAKNFVGKAVSRVAMLSFFTQKVPKLVIGPEISKLREGSPFVLKVVSPPADELKEFNVYWTFNGMRIKGALGPELSIATVKKKYEGEYKAMIAVGSGIETSNLARLSVLPAKVEKPAPVAAPSPLAAVEANQPEELMQQEKSLEDILAAEPTVATDASLKPQDNWEDFLFNPEDESEEDEQYSVESAAKVEEIPEEALVAPSATPEVFGNTSPGTPGGKAPPLTQLATQDLIREVAAQGGVSELLQTENLPSDALTSPEATEDLIADWGALEIPAKPSGVRQLSGATPSPRPRPQLLKKKEFLENFLFRLQNRAGKKAA